MTLWRRGLLRRLDYFVSVGFPLFDFLAVYLSAHLALLTSDRFEGAAPPHYEIVVFFGALMVPAWLGRVGAYKPWRGQSTFVELRQLTLAWGAFFASLAVLALATKAGGLFSRVWLAHTMVIGWGVLAISRIIIRYALNQFRAKGFNSRFVILVGEPERCKLVAEELGRAKWSGLTVVEMVNVEEADALSALADVFQSREVDQLWLAMDLKDVDRINAVQSVAAPFPVKVMWSPDLVGVHLLNHKVAEVAGLPVVALQDRPLSGSATLLKVIEDRVLAFSILVLMAVPMLCLSLIHI